MKLFLDKRNSYKWSNSMNICFHGYFIYENKYYSSESALEFLNNNRELNLLLKALPQFNGVYSFIVENDDYCFFAVDRLRGLPLLYYLNNDELFVGDDVDGLMASFENKSVDKTSVKELLSTGTYVSGRYTLIKNVYQVEPSSICVFEKKSSSITTEHYYKTQHTNFLIDDIVVKESFFKAYSDTGNCMITALHNRTAVIPLSGGADSRMILKMLSDKGYRNVVCFTYGKKGNRESNISELIAKKYGYKWIFVEYSPKMWKSVRKSAESREYKRFSNKLVSAPHFQDFLAVKYLKENKLIPNDSVFIPGHSGDIPNGNHIARVYLNETVTKKDCLESMLDFTYLSRPKEVVKRLLETHPIPEDGTPQDFSDVEEWFDTSERQSKYIVNSVRVYEFFGYEWLIPLWDNYQLEFWSHIDLHTRYKRRLYYKLVNDQDISTNDIRKRDSFFSRIRRLPLINNFARRTNKILNWWKSPLMMEHMFPFFTYLKACLIEKPTFTVSKMFANEVAKEVTKKYEKKHIK